MVTTDKSYAVSIPHFKCEEQKECLDRMESTIDEIAHEYIISLGAISANLEKFHEIVKLAVDVTAYRDG